jgi:hypothetical protein
VFDTVRTTPESELLFRVSAGFSPTRGIGAVRSPAGGAGFRPKGGRFAFLSGRPYRWNHTQLQGDVASILAARFYEPPGAVAVEDPPVRQRLVLEPVAPNPSSGSALLRFVLPKPGRVRLRVLDVSGRRTRLILDSAMPAGAHERFWDGVDERGVPAPAGLYWVKLEASGESAARRLVRIP